MGVFKRNGPTDKTILGHKLFGTKMCPASDNVERRDTASLKKTALSQQLLYRKSSSLIKVFGEVFGHHDLRTLPRKLLSVWIKKTACYNKPQKLNKPKHKMEQTVVSRDS
jgi:hypothetical protein